MPTHFDTLLTDELIRTHTDSGRWKNRLLLDYLDQAVAARPDATAVVDARGVRTYRQLAADVDRTALALHSLGLRPADVVGIQLPNWYEWVVIHLAVMRNGAVTNALIPIYRDREIGYMARKAQVSVLFVASSFRGFDYPDMVDRLREQLPALRHTVVLDAVGAEPFRARRGFLRWDDLLASAGDQPGPDWAQLRPDPNELSLVLFTSGTTGRPKGVMHTHNTVLAGAFPWDGGLGLDHTSVIHMASTFGHLTGYMYGVCLPLILGGTGVFQDVWSASQFIDWVERYRINHTSGATPFLHDLLRAPGLGERDLSSLRHFCCMGAPIPRAMMAEAKAVLPGLSVFGGWGQTECCLVTMTSPDDPPEKVVSTDGRPLGGMEVRTVDFAGEPCPPGTEGRVQVRGPFLFQGYLGELDATRQEFDGDWFDTGDLAVIDEDGYIKLSGRSKDIIIRGGENIPVAYVENVLYEHPDIEAAALVAVPHPRLQEIAGAVVTLRPGAELDIDGLREFLADKGVAKQYWPELLEITEEFPRTPSGKIQKYKLREEILAQLESADGPPHSPQS
ncbi:cyclohexanecarboxylate-CoA ligase [Brevibacterium daeguense]|uniref:Cyclohexanecarboxylate-CoA ligase n=1 Tax=Brevibacterium daeguense TaxID=909936 RepID=A0ABP8EIY8_9MICO|nr:AMP-binding protein [Brevibacterium daeguense]